MDFHKLDDAFELVRSVGLTGSLSEFSQTYLGQNQSYWRTLKCTKTEPSLGAVAICAARMKSNAEKMLATKQYRHIGLKFMYASEQLREIVNDGCVELDLDGSE